MSKRRNCLVNNIEQLRKFLEDLNEMNNWINNISLELLRQNSLSSCSSPSPPRQNQDQQSKNKSSTPSPSFSTQNLSELNVYKTLRIKIFYNNVLFYFKYIKLALNSKLGQFNNLKSLYESINVKSNNKIPDYIKLKMESLLIHWEKLEESLITASSIKLSSATENAETTDGDILFRRTLSIKKQAPIAPGFQEKEVGVNMTSHNTENEILEKEKTKDLEISTQEETIPNGIKLIAVSEFNDQLSMPCKEIESISNDLFDWLVWIDHTLQSQVITVGDLEEIQQAIHKYNVSTK